MFDTLRFLKDHFGEPRALVAFLRAYGVDAPPEGTVDKWYRRSAIPSTWLPVLLAYLELDRGAPVSTQPYLKG